MVDILEFVVDITFKWSLLYQKISEWWYDISQNLKVYHCSNVGPHLNTCDDKTSLNEHHLTLNWVPILDKIGSPWQVGAVSYPSYKYYFRKFFSMQLITGSDFNNAGISCKENLDLWIVLFAPGELISLSLNPFNDSLDAVLHRFKNQEKSYFR